MAQRDSGSTQEEFCRRHGLALSTFHRWRQRLFEAEAPQEVSVRPGFVEVRSRPERRSCPSADGEGGFELEFSSGMCLRLPSRIDGQDLAEVLCALQARKPMLMWPPSVSDPSGYRTSRYALRFRWFDGPSPGGAGSGSIFGFICSSFTTNVETGSRF